MSIAVGIGTDLDNRHGHFNTSFRPHIFQLLQMLGVYGLNFRDPMSDEEALRRLRLALWDSQRLDYLFPGKSFENNDTLSLIRLPSWPGWKNKHTLPDMTGRVKLDHYKNAEKLDSWVFRHFQMSAFTQMENMTGSNRDPSPLMDGSLIGVKNAMASVAVAITSEGGKNLPFFTCYSPHYRFGESMLIMEILDVKEAAWPEPSAKEWELIRSVQQTKFGHPADGPIVPMLRTPKMPVILVRYSYTEGHPPKGGLQFMTYLENKLKKSGMNARKAREQLEHHIQSGLEMPQLHVRTFARFLSANSDLVDPEWKAEMQSHWSGLSQEVIKETNISFIAPMLRLRWKTIEEIALGQKPEKKADCSKCGKSNCKLSCSACKSVVYCSAECNRADWPKHKEICKFSERLFKTPRELPENKFYIYTRCVHETVLDTGFAVDQEGIKQSGCPKAGTCPLNEYGRERFQVRVQAPPDWTVDGGKYRGQTIFLCDRRRSLFVRGGPDDVIVAKERLKKIMPFDKEGHIKLVRLLREKGLEKQLLFLWAKRIGDTLEIDLQDVHENQAKIAWD